MIKRLLSFLWMLIAGARACLYSKNIFKSHGSSIRIISVGNISLGGAGKTPFVLWLIKRFMDKGLKTAVIERGYKSGLPKKECKMWQKGKDQIGPILIGDEPQMLWEALPSGARLCVCSDKTKGVMEVEKKWSDSDVIVVDDGFQHLRLKRNINIVLMEAIGAFEDRIFPMGRLREAYSSLKRADIIVFTKADVLKERDLLIEKAKNFNPNIKIFFADSIFKSSIDLKGKKVFPLSSIYNPKYFHLKLKEAGADFERYMAFRDHYAYDLKTVKMIIDNAKNLGVKYVALTSKDWVKIKPILSDELKVGIEFIECSYEHTLENEEEFLNCSI